MKSPDFTNMKREREEMEKKRKKPDVMLEFKKPLISQVSEMSAIVY